MDDQNYPENKPYAPSIKTDVLATFKRLGWTPPSERQDFKDKWAHYRRLAQISEEALA